jgi:hypothetical protein
MVLVCFVASRSDKFYLFEDVLRLCQQWLQLEKQEGALALFWVTKVAIAGWINSVIHIGRACRRLFAQGACLMKFPAVDPKNEASR